MSLSESQTPQSLNFKNNKSDLDGVVFEIGGKKWQNTWKL